MYCLDEFYKVAWNRLAGKVTKEVIPIGFTQKQINELFISLETKEINEMTTARFVMGSMRYNAKGLKVAPKYSLLKTMQQKLDLYNETGNSENLLDLINYCKLEFLNKQHPRAHFNPVDDGIHAVTH